MLAVARALVVEPAVLILDEPSAGLSPKIVAEVFARLKAINAAGVTTVLVEQNVRAALAIADRAVILVEGRIAHEGPAATLADDPIVAELYLGARASTKAAVMNPQVLIDGLIGGAMIGLGAIGVTLTYSILRFANFAHGEFLAWGAYIALAVSGALGSLVRRAAAPDRPLLLRLVAADRRPRRRSR